MLSKADLPEGAAQRPALRAALQALNPAAVLIEAADGEPDADLLLGQDLFTPEHKSAEVARWLAAAANRRYLPVHAGGSGTGRHRDITSFVLRLPPQVDWSAFCLWLSLLVHRHGPRILRIKGVLRVDGASAPVAIHVVQQLIHPPVHLGQDVPDLEGSLLVFIVQGLDADRVQASAALALARPGVPSGHGPAGSR